MPKAFAVALLIGGIGFYSLSSPSNEDVLSVEKKATGGLDKVSKKEGKERKKIESFSDRKNIVLRDPFTMEHETRESKNKVDVAGAKSANVKPTNEELAGKNHQNVEKKAVDGTSQEDDIRLVGTLLADGSNMAIIKAGKKQVLLKLGETENGITLLEIANSSVLVAVGDKEFKLEI